MELVKRGNERLLIPFEGVWEGEVREAYMVDRGLAWSWDWALQVPALLK